MESLALLFGLIVGSFINVLVVRTHTHEGMWGRSKCPHCGTYLAWYELIPIVSFLLQRGQCRTCALHISLQYPLVEAATALGFLGIAAWSPASLVVWMSGVYAVSVAIVAYDLLYREIPDSFVAVLAVFAVLGLFLFWRDTILVRVLSGLGFSAFFLLLYLLSRGRWIGGGDIKLAFVLGLLVGWPLVLVLFLSTYVVGAIVAGLLLLFRRVQRGSPLPFAPFLIVSLFLTFFWGNDLMNWYLELLF